MKNQHQIKDSLWQVTQFRELSPYTEIEKKWSTELIPNQILRIPSIVGVTDERSVKQLRRYCGKCRRLAEETPLSQDNNWNTTTKVSEQIKWALGWVDHENAIVLKNGSVMMRTKSISFSALPHLAACSYFERADAEFEKICKRLDIPKSFLEYNGA